MSQYVLKILFFVAIKYIEVKNIRIVYSIMHNRLN